MRRYQLALCVLALLAPPVAQAQDGDVWVEDDQAEYEAYFGRTDGAYEPGPKSLAEAKKEGRGYRIGQDGIHASEDAAPPPGDVHVVQEGDTLWGITERYFQDPWKWPQVWAWNPEITNPHWIYPLDNVRLSEEALEYERAIAGKATPGTTGTNLDRLPVTGSRVHRVGQGQGAKLASTRSVPPGTVFLRDQGYLERDALKKAGQVLSAPEEQMLLGQSDELYVTVDDGDEPKPGDLYTLFRPLQPIERLPHAEGELVQIFGTAQIRTYDPDTKVARAVVVEANAVIERGIRVTRMGRRFDVVPPKKNTANVVARIIASVKAVDMMAYGDVVFLDVGEGNEVAPGNLFFVVRREDNWAASLERSPKDMGNIESYPAPDPESMPKQVVAELRVVKVRKDNTIAVVVRSDTDLAVGDLAEMRAGF